jgi:hypothetical protein
MRDTDLLRLRLQATLTCFSLSLAGSVAMGCGDDAAAREKPLSIAKPVETDDTKRPRSKAKNDAKAAKPASGDPIPAGTDPSAAGVPPLGDRPPANPDGWEFDYYGPPRDPFAPHDEEEGCPKGDWCGSPADAALFEVKGLEPVLGCPSRIVANPEAKIDNPKAKKWKGLSFDGRMQGRLVSTTTEETRKKKKSEDLCCYHWFEYCSGRPLLDDDTQVLAALRRGDAWSSDPDSVGGPAPDLDARTRERLAAAWLEDARMEHASIAAFARATLELMALGAPPALLADVQRASLDEVRHAGRCFALAARYSGAQREPGPLPALAPRPANHAQLAADTFIEGCVGETIAALMASRQARGCADDAVRETLVMIADDEARHAALAWRTIEWALAQDGPAVAEALRRAADDLRPTPEEVGAVEADEPSLRAHGRLGARAQADARLDAWREIIDPTLDRLLAAPAQPRA